MPLNEQNMGQPVFQALCRHEVGAYLTALEQPDDLLVACTQEKPLFTALAESKTDVRATALRFVNIRESACWSSQADQALPKVKALLAVAGMSDPDPVPSVSYRSHGRLLVLGPASRVTLALDILDSFEGLEATTIVTDRDALIPAGRARPAITGIVTSLQGYLGAFEVCWVQSNPIDLEVCTRCGACQTACPEGAISQDFQVDMDRCSSSRDCVKACDAIGAIRFDRPQNPRKETFDLVLDLSDKPFFSQFDTPKGYCFSYGEMSDLFKGVAELATQVGEFEKPKFFNYEKRLCAHGRNRQKGCSLCIDVCSTSAIRSVFREGRGEVEVNPNLCLGCGACSTVCPSGAMRYAYPTADRVAQEVRFLLAAYEKAGGKSASLLFFGSTAEWGDGQVLIDTLGRSARLGELNGMPAHVLPMGQHHVASVGIEVWLAALCFGAGEVLILLTGREGEGYAEMLESQVGVAQAFLEIAGLRANAIRTLRASDSQALSQALDASPPQSCLVSKLAGFTLGQDKRSALEVCFQHLLKFGSQTQTPADLPAPLPAGAPVGGLLLNSDRCTLCMSCVGACPEGALKDGGDKPLLAFIERNCVQCGLCVKTCPEQALALDPRLAPLLDRREALTINEATPLCCVRCGRPFGTRQALKVMIDKIGSHPAFQGDAARRMEMCSDCRVVDMVEKEL